MSEWKPIASAPKQRPDAEHGEQFLVYIPSRHPAEQFQCGMQFANGSWWIGDGRYNDQPTHWMPLPPPPVEDR